jgi:hypothetical protein
MTTQPDLIEELRAVIDDESARLLRAGNGDAEVFDACAAVAERIRHATPRTRQRLVTASIFLATQAHLAARADLSRPDANPGAVFD